MEALPDPVAGVSYTNDTLTDLTLGSSIMSNLTLSWSQELPYPGKRGLAGDVARREIEVTGGVLEETRLAVAAGVKAAYSELYRLDRTLAILGESRALLVSFLETARSRYETGEGHLENVLKAQTELTKLEARLATVAQERRSAEVALNAQVGRPDDAPLGPALAPPLADRPEAGGVERAVLERSPVLLALRAAESRDGKRLELAERNLKPDFMWSAAYMHRGGLDPMVMGMFGVRLPVYRKQKQAEAVVQSRHELEASRHEITRQEVELRARVRDLLARADRAGTVMDLIAEGILPQARGALDSAAAAYATGGVSFLALLDDFVTLLDYEVDYETQRADRIAALAALEPLAGTVYVRPAQAGGTHPGEGGSDE